MSASAVPAKNGSSNDPGPNETTTDNSKHNTASGEDATDIRATNDKAFVKNHDAETISLGSSHAPPLAAATPLVHRSAPKHSPQTSLHVQTNMETSTTAGAPREMPTILYDNSINAPPHQSHASPEGSALRSVVSSTSLASSFSPSSTSALSPFLASMTEITPLPSPIVGSSRPVDWRTDESVTTGRSRGGSLDNMIPLPRSASQPTSPTSPSKRKKGYGSLMQEAAIANASVINPTAFIDNAKASAQHTRNRSISDFVPEQLQNVRQRHVTFGPGDAPSLEAAEYQMHREAYLAAHRGVTTPTVDASQRFPTPPPSSSSVAESEEADDEQPFLEDGSASEYLEIHCGIHNKRRKFRQLRQLGQGTFSTVMLATREKIPAHPTPEIEEHLDPHKLVAVKIVEHGPAGGADEERIEISLKREVEMLKSVSHPSLIHLKACEYFDKRTLLVLTYCPGGDLFEFASQKRDLLSAHLIQRMFAELVSAVRYLHEHWIVHRDIKLENVLVNIPESSLRSLSDPLSHPTPIVTLTDMGLSRRIPSPPDPPLLTTRCGSEDYAAPEILLGQPYDGRQTDAWALGVLLYALMEGRLPFDAPPGRPDRSRNTHRIARCDWIWCRFGDEDGDWDPARGKDFEGARPCVENLLRKVRMGRKSLAEVEKYEWVRQGIRVEEGLKMREEDEDGDLL